MDRFNLSDNRWHASMTKALENQVFFGSVQEESLWVISLSMMSLLEKYYGGLALLERIQGEPLRPYFGW